MPCLIAVQPTRSTAGATSFAYYAAASLPVIGVAKAYWPSSEASAVFMWMAAAALLSVPWFFCWTRLESLRPWTAAVAVALTAVPPLCIIGWASPLLSAGVLFPNSAWFGIAAVLALPGLLIHKRTRLIALLVASAASVFLNTHVKEFKRPTGWQGEMTRIHRPRKADDLADFAIEEELQHIAQSSGSKVLVFPEGAVRLWTDATDAFWAPAVSDAGKTLLIGAGRANPRLSSVQQLRRDRRRARPSRFPSANSSPRWDVESVPAAGRSGTKPPWPRYRRCRRPARGHPHLLRATAHLADAAVRHREANVANCDLE